jgi:hypothetical protein
MGVGGHPHAPAAYTAGKDPVPIVVLVVNYYYYYYYYYYYFILALHHP